MIIVGLVAMTHGNKCSADLFPPVFLFFGKNNLNRIKVLKALTDSVYVFISIIKIGNGELGF